MLFLPIILIFNLFAKNIEEVQVEKLITKYLNQASSGQVDQKLYSKEYNHFIEGDKEVFSVCKKNKCHYKMNLTKVDSQKLLWLARIKTQYKSKNSTHTVAHKQGCFYVKNMRMYAYVEDCDGR